MVWAGLKDGHLIGPYVFEENIDRFVYIDFLQNTLPGLLEEKMGEQERRRIIFQQDNASPHTAHATVEVLHEMFPDGLIGPNGLIEWPSR